MKVSEGNAAQHRLGWVDEPSNRFLQYLDAGDSVYVSAARPPDCHVLTLGHHFAWDVPRHGRNLGAKAGRLTHDPSTAAIFTALVPILVTMVNPWVDHEGNVTGEGCASLGHFRLARSTDLKVDFAESMPGGIVIDFRLRDSCRNEKRPEHRVPGGMKNAVLYSDEVVVPAYFYKKENERLPFCYIVNSGEFHALLMNHGKDRRMEKSLQAGKSVALRVASLGPKRQVKVNEECVVTIDEAGLVFNISKAGLPRASYTFKNGVKMTINTIISHPQLRAIVGLQALPEMAMPGTVNEVDQTPLPVMGPALANLSIGVVEVSEVKAAATAMILPEAPLAEPRTEPVATAYIAPSKPVFECAESQPPIWWRRLGKDFVRKYSGEISPARMYSSFSDFTFVEAGGRLEALQCYLMAQCHEVGNLACDGQEPEDLELFYRFREDVEELASLVK